MDRLYARAGARLGDGLARTLRERPTLEAQWTPARAAAYGIAFSVYAFDVALLVGGGALAVFGLPNPFALVGGLVMALAAVAMRPRPPKPPEDGVLDRTRAPTLHAVVDEIAAALETPTADVIVVDHRFNASWSMTGRKRERTLTLGLPLFAVLSPQQRVGLIAHELAHARNGDASRGIFVGSAVEALATLYFLLAPEQLGRREWQLGAFEHLVNAFFWLISRPVWWLLALELHLLLRDAQRAEFLADVLAADVAGAKAMVALHERTLLDSTFASIVRRVAGGGSADVLFERAASVLDAVPERERERRRRIARLEAARLDATHPPVAHRIELIEARGRAEPRRTLDPARSAAIDAELSPSRRAAARRLVDDYRDSLYA